MSNITQLESVRSRFQLQEHKSRVSTFHVCIHLELPHSFSILFYFFFFTFFNDNMIFYYLDSLEFKKLLTSATLFLQYLTSGQRIHLWENPQVPLTQQISSFILCFHFFFNLYLYLCNTPWLFEMFSFLCIPQIHFLTTSAFGNHAPQKIYKRPAKGQQKPCLLWQPTES